MKLKSKLKVWALSAVLGLSPLLLWPLGVVAQVGDSKRASNQLSMVSGVVALGSMHTLEERTLAEVRRGMLIWGWLGAGAK